MRRRVRKLRPVSEQLDERCLLSADQILTSLPDGLTPAELTRAYGLDDITFQTVNGAVSGNGAGQTIALVEAYHDSTIQSDLSTFDAAYGLPDPSFTQISLGVPVSNPGWGLEESLDVEWAHAIAPAASIVVVEAGSQSRSNLLQAVDVAREMPSVSVVSMSWGFSEVSYEGSAHFQTPAGHQPITFIAASGDSGTAAGSEWPSVSPYVVSAGGTTLYTDEEGNYQYETAWSGSGGGFSKYMFEPGYQRSVQATGRRSTPDVSLVGDPNTGVEVYESSPGGGGSWQIVGGTSLSTPGWGAIIAIADQGRVLAGETTLNGATQTLPTLYAIAASNYHGVVGSMLLGGGSTLSGVSIQTGLGSPVAPLVINDLVSSSIDVPLTTSRTSAVESARQIVKAHKKQLKLHTQTGHVLHLSPIKGTPTVLDGLRRGDSVLKMIESAAHPEGVLKSAGLWT